jgi:hypothetical protein
MRTVSLREMRSRNPSMSTANSRGSGRSRSATARSMTWAMRASPFNAATVGSSAIAARKRGFSPVIVESCTSCSPSDGSTCSM